VINIVIKMFSADITWTPVAEARPVPRKKESKDEPDNRSARSSETSGSSRRLRWPLSRKAKSPTHDIQPKGAFKSSGLTVDPTTIPHKDQVYELPGTNVIEKTSVRSQTNIASPAPRPTSSLSGATEVNILKIYFSSMY